MKIDRKVAVVAVAAAILHRGQPTALGQHGAGIPRSGGGTGDRRLAH